MVEAGADKDAAKSNSGTMALFIAAQNGHLEVVRLLLDAGSDKDAATTDGTTALLAAAHKGHLEIARLLLDAGVDKDHDREMQ